MEATSIAGARHSYSKKIEVSNLDKLYAALNDLSNESALIILSPGTYVLNQNYPNSGRIELQKNMALEGQAGRPESVIIDASLLPGTSFVPPLNFPAARTGAIRMGKGNNSIEWLTVKGNSSTQALSVIDTDLIGDSECHVTIAHCIVRDGRIGIDIRNAGIASKDRIINC
jgi:hypothetical protein